MADWFRWWHGTTTDAKFGVISSKADCSLCEVIAVWAYLLEHSSECHIRGDVSRYVTVTDNVTGVVTRYDGVTEIAWALRMRNETVTSIVTELCNASLIVDGRIEAWERRQPTREDAVNTGSKTNSQRQKEYRERKKKQGLNSNAPVTQSNAPVTHQKREEKNRTEQIKPLSLRAEKIHPESVTRKGTVCGLLRKAGMSDSAPHYLTDEVWETILAKRTDEEIVEVAKAKMASMPNQRIGLKYIAKALLDDPAPIAANARASPHQTIHDKRSETIAALTGRATSHERNEPNERDITGESTRVA